MVLFEIHQRFKGHFLNELRVSFKACFSQAEIHVDKISLASKISYKVISGTCDYFKLICGTVPFFTYHMYPLPRSMK